MTNGLTSTTQVLSPLTVFQAIEQRIRENAVLEFIEQSEQLYRHRLGAPQVFLDLRGGRA